jgi:tetratricopeptide (TPR) repeat protein
MKIFNLESEIHLSECRKKVFVFLALFIIVLSIYSNTFHASWHFDDEPNITANPSLHLEEFSWHNIKETFFSRQIHPRQLYRPMACLSFALNYYFGRDNVFGYHLVNISIHLLTAVFLFLFIYQTLNLPSTIAKYGPHSYFISLLATVLWAINPVQIQAVTYIVQRMASMAGMFYIMSMYFYLKGRISRQRIFTILLYFCCVISTLLAFGSKENTAMLPISILLFDLFLIQGVSKENIKRNSFILMAVILIPVGIALALKGPSLFSASFLVSSYQSRGFTLLERLLTEPRIVLFYISLLFYPMPDRLCIAHDISISHSLVNPPTTFLAIFTILGILVVAIIKSKKYPLISYCIIFFFLNHVIESTIFGLELIFEHRNYIPSMLLFVPIAILIVRGIKFFSYKRSMQAAICLFVILVLVGQGHTSFMRNFIWKTEESLWLDAVEKSPNMPRVHHNLARYYGDAGQIERAIAQYKEALALKRSSHGESHHLTHYNLALIYMKIGKDDEAIKHLEKAIEIAPKYADAYNNLAIILAKRGQYDDAFNLLIKSLTYDRNSPQAHNNLAFILLRTNRIDEAISEFKKALALKDGDPTFLQNLGIAYKYKGYLNKGARCFRSVLKKDPRALLARLHLAETYWLMGKKEVAKRMVSSTLDLLPPKVVHSKIKVLFQEDSIQELPERSIILPLLEDAYLERSACLEKMGRDLRKGQQND